MNLAIKGHPVRGSEVIALLEMLGGKIRRDRLAGKERFSWYYINENGYIDYKHYSLFDDTTAFALEEFFEKFPYKVGDKVVYKPKPNQIFTIEKAHWDGYKIVYVIGNEDEVIIHTYSKELQSYKEETMEKEISGAIIDRFICLEGYDFYDDKGNIIDTKEITMKKKQSKYPKTYVECAKVLGRFSAVHIDGYKGDLLGNLQELIICRDAYWKIAGAEMGLDKSWEPDWSNAAQRKYCIVNTEGNVLKWVQKTTNKILAFPTEEMRDAFYENFKDLIEQCKELL